MRTTYVWRGVFLAAAMFGAATVVSAATEVLPTTFFHGSALNAHHHPSGTAVILYDQTGNDSGNGYSSQNFETAFDTFDDEGADDFIVTDSGGWQVSQVFAPGVYFNGPGPVNSVNVVFWPDASGIPGASAICTYLGVVPTTDAAGTFTIDLPTACALPQGTFWVEVQANMDFGVGGQWGWEGGTVLFNSPAAWQNPGGGFGVGCTTWGTLSGCIQGTPSFLFQISGTAGPSQPPFTIPTLGKAGIAALILLLAGLSVVVLRRRAA